METYKTKAALNFRINRYGIFPNLSMETKQLNILLVQQQESSMPKKKKILVCLIKVYKFRK